MDDISRRPEIARAAAAPLTTRRSFIAVASLGAVSLYGLWAAMGAAPLRFWEQGESGEGAMDMPAGGGGHEGHGAALGPTPDEFRRLTEEFIARYGLQDGSVAVGPAEAALPMAGMAMPSHADTSAHEMPGMEAMTMAHGETIPAVDVFLLAQQWSFEPLDLRLRRDVPYRIRLMAVDAAHGASLQLGQGSHVIRLPKGVLVERQMTFTEPGEFLLYCTVYCGEGHQYMSGKIRVA